MREREADTAKTTAKMIAHWIFFFSAFLLLISYQHIFRQDSESWVYSLRSNEHTKKGNSSNLQSRQKRAVTSNISEYVVDVEISFFDPHDPQFLELFRNFVNSPEFLAALNASETDVTIESVNITTVCNISGNTTQCCCENRYKWPTYTCSSAPSQNCSCISTFPLEGPYCQLISSQVIITNMSLTIKETFTADLNNPSSGLYINYKTKLESVFNDNYKILPGFISTSVTGFSPGSVIADYNILTEQFTPQQLDAVNNEVIRNLSKSFVLGDPPITATITYLTNFTVSPEPTFEGDELNMMCKTEANSTDITWLNGTTQLAGNGISYTIYPPIIQNGISVSVLKITHITLFDQGKYTCRLKQSGIIYESSYNITVQPITFTSSINLDIVCNGNDFKVLNCCREDGNINSLNAAWTPVAGLSTILGDPGSTSNCFTYSLSAMEIQCPAERSGEVTTYRCDIKAGNVLKTYKEINVTFYRNANVTITSNNRHQFSVGEQFLVNCNSDVTNIINVTWKIINETSKEETLIDQKYYNPISKTSPTSILNITASMYWNGTYRCTVFQAKVNNFVNTTIVVFPLPLQNEIIIYPVQGYYYRCPSTITIQCCVMQGNYDVKLNINNNPLDNDMVSKPNGNQLCYTNNFNPCKSDNITAYCLVTNSNIKEVKYEVRSSNIMLTKIPDIKDIICNDSSIGIGEKGSVAIVPCQVNANNQMAGNMTFTCHEKWDLTANNCISASIFALLSSAQLLNSSPQPSKQLVVYLQDLRNTTKTEQTAIQNSTGNLGAMVQILSTISNIPAVNVTTPMMNNFLFTVNTIVENKTINTWKNLNNAGKEDSSLLLQSVENFSKGLEIVTPGNFNNTNNPNVQLQGTLLGNDTNEDYNKTFYFISSTDTSLNGSVFISHTNLSPSLKIITIAYSTLKDILPKDNNSNTSVNGLVMTTVIPGSGVTSPNFSISMNFSLSNHSLKNPKCAFWNFSLFPEKAGWDYNGCQNYTDNDNVICNCSHLTSFSILMSSFDEVIINNGTLELITYIGVGISLGSLVLCITIEALVWKAVTKNRTSYMRHVCFINIVVSLLIADIWFIIGGIPKIDKKSDVCVTITFFTHFFYLSLFFWMLAMALKLLYLMIYVFQNMSKSTMLVIAFVLGYGCPLIISVITIAVTQPAKSYTKQGSCWLNVKETKAFLAFVVPALTIVAVNFIIFLITIIKILRPSIGDRPRREENSTVLQIAKSVAVLTPLLGLTWGFGLGVAINNNKVLLAIFAALNSFQGFFILVFGTLWDRKVREALLKKFRLSRWPSQQTKSSASSAETPKSFSTAINRFFGKTGKYNISSAEATSTSLSGTLSDSYSLLE